jgi:succinate dehydrogenase/fumarate reductase flavoprotein subunit
MSESQGLVHRKDPVAVTYFSHEKAEFPNMPPYLVFDERYRLQGPLGGRDLTFGDIEFTYARLHTGYQWSQDNRSEIEQGWILKANSISELATRAGIDLVGLETTIDRYNRFCAARKDADFGRAEDQLVPICHPPYYVAELGLTVINTQGGPKHNARCQVLGVNNQPIPRLYAAGEFGSFFGFLYQGGSNLPEALAFGLIAGEEAAALEPW